LFLDWDVLCLVNLLLLGLQPLKLSIVLAVQAVGAVEAASCGPAFPRFNAVVSAGFWNDGPHAVTAHEKVVKFV
jgi:hypothetical protein